MFYDTVVYYQSMKSEEELEVKWWSYWAFHHRHSCQLYWLIPCNARHQTLILPQIYENNFWKHIISYYVSSLKLMFYFWKPTFCSGQALHKIVQKELMFHIEKLTFEKVSHCKNIELLLVCTTLESCTCWSCTGKPWKCWMVNSNLIPKVDLSE